MRAMRILGEGQAIVTDRPEPKPGPGQVLLKMKAAAICGSDLHRYKLKLSDDDPTRRFVPGHEPCGDIVEIGPDVSGWSVGERAVVYHRVTCMQCLYCIGGERNLCVNRIGAYGFDPDGANQDYMIAAPVHLIRLADDFDHVDGALFACQVGTAYHPLKTMNVSGRDRLVVSGLGPVGLFTLLLAKAMGAVVAGVDPSPERRRLAEGLGADAVFDPTANPIGEAVNSLFPGGADKLAETSGVSSAHRAISSQLRTNGQAAIIGLAHPGAPLDLGDLDGILFQQIRVFGSNLYPNKDFDEIVDFVRRKKVPIKKVITHEMGVEDGPEAFQLAAGATAGKIVFRFD